MAGLFLVATREPDFARAAVARAHAQFARHGFRTVDEIELPGWRLLHAAPIQGGPESLLVDGDDLVAVAGTLTCDGRLGRPALQALLDMGTMPDWSRLGGQFVALVRKGGKAVLFTDYFGAFHLFHDVGHRLFSTSLLSVAGALPRLSFDTQAVYEFAFNVVPLGDDTILAEVKRLGPDRLIALEPDGARTRPLAKPLPEAVSAEPVPERIERHGQRLAEVVQPHAEAFGDDIFCPLSGGLDSRLVLAALRATGARPNIYVYGEDGEGDVRIARRIGAALGFDVDAVDKVARPNPPPEAFPELVDRAFHDHDGLPNFGNLFDNGGNAAARKARHAGGALAVSGGCGEIFRNFFYLPDRPTRAADVARAFFARYSRRDATGLFDERAFLRAIENKILYALGLDGERGPLPRAAIEQVYPRVRCRALFGKEISDEARFGPYLMPFLDHRLVAEAVRLPLPLKNAGRFEAMLIAAIDPELARQPSAYGHHFAEPPSVGHRFGEWSTRVRPPWLRHRSYALQRRLGRSVHDEHGGLLAPDYLGRVIDLDLPLMRCFFRTERLAADNGLLRRVACLEYFGERLGVGA
jgi:hypothetical protein